MKLWMSGEVMGDVDADFAPACREIEREINQILASDTYSVGISEWAFIAIILNLNHNGYSEVRRYHRKDSSFEFRLAISHERFKVAAPMQKRGLIIEALLRSLNDMDSMIRRMRLSALQIDLKKLSADIGKLSLLKGWMAME